MRKIIILGLLGLSGCAGGVTLAPHLNRERELAPAATAERYGVVLDKAAAFEAQNQKSRDVYWYRMWKAGAMIGLGQIDQAIGVIDQVLAEMSASGTVPAQADRLRAFGYDLRARGALLQGRPKDALADLERSYNLAADLELETRGDCDQPMMLAARSKQLEDVARLAGDETRAVTARGALARQLDKWSKCLAERDYPGLSVVGALAMALTTSPAPAPAPAPVAVAPPAQPPPAAPAARSKKEEPAKTAPPPPSPPPARPVEKPQAAGVASLPTMEAQYAPVDATPWREAIDSVLALAGKQAQGARGDIVIRTDGGHHALRMRVSMPKLEAIDELVPIFRSTVVFFEQARNVTPKVERVLLVIEGGPSPVSVIAQKNDVLELFQERLDAAAFAKRLMRVM